MFRGEGWRARSAHESPAATAARLESHAGGGAEGGGWSNHSGAGTQYRIPSTAPTQPLCSSSIHTTAEPQGVRRGTASVHCTQSASRGRRSAAKQMLLLNLEQHNSQLTGVMTGTRVHQRVGMRNWELAIHH